MKKKKKRNARNESPAKGLNEGGDNGERGKKLIHIACRLLSWCGKRDYPRCTRHVYLSEFTNFGRFSHSLHSPFLTVETLRVIQRDACLPPSFSHPSPSILTLSPPFLMRVYVYIALYGIYVYTYVYTLVMHVKRSMHTYELFLRRAS